MYPIWGQNDIFCITNAGLYRTVRKFSMKHSKSKVTLSFQQIMYVKKSYQCLFLLLVALISVVYCNIHGGSFLAMTGKDSVVLISDSRFSSPKTGSMLLGKYPRQVIRVGSKCMIGCFGLDNDSRTLMHKLRRKLRDHNDEEIGPENISRVVSDILYNNNLVISPVIVGLQKDGKPYICTMDGLGAQTVSNKFAVLGTANEGLLALCESLYSDNLEAPMLIDLAEHCFNMAMQRDVMSGCDFRVFTITKDAIHMKDIEKLDV